MLRKIIKFFKLLPVAVFLCIHLLGFLGHVHPLFDTFANLRIVTSAILVLLTIMLMFEGRGLWAMISLAAAAVGVFSFGIEFPAIASPPGNFKLVQFDLGRGARKPEEIVIWLNAQKPDLVTLLSVGVEDIKMLDLVKATFPSQLLCDGVKGKIAILSASAFTESTCSATPGFGHVALMRDGKNLHFGAMQLELPYPGKQWQQVAAFVPELQNIKDPMVLAVGLNAMPWAGAAQRLADASHARAVAGPKLTLQVFKIPALPVAQVFADAKVGIADVRVGADLGSSHLPLMVDLIWQ